MLEALKRRWYRMGGVACMLVPICAQELSGQLVPQHTETAAPLPPGMIRLTAAPSWNRTAAWLTGQGGETTPLGAALQSGALGTDRFRGLTPFEDAIRTITDESGFRLSLGRLDADVSTRVVQTRFALEYGFTRRVSAGVMVPMVQTRTLPVLALNVGGSGNVGPNPARINPARFAEVVAVRQQINTAAADLTQRLAQCRANPAQAGCDALLAQESAAMELIARSTAVVQGLTTLYGATPADRGSPFVPVTGSAPQVAIEERLAQMSAAYAAFLGTTGEPITARPPFAVAGAGVADLRDLFLTREFGLAPDTLIAMDRIGVGDVEVGARFLVVDSWGGEVDTAALPRRIRVALTALVRLPTGAPARPQFYLDQPLGDGQTDIEGGAVVDLLSGRFGATLSARYTAQLGEVETARVPDEAGWVNPFDPLVPGTRTLGDILSVHVIPRARLGPSLSVDGHWAVVHRGDDNYRFDVTGLDPEELILRPMLDGPRGGFTAQQVGLGLTFSTLPQWEQGRVRVPIEVTFSHQRTVSASGAAVPRTTTDMIQLRLHYRLFRR